MEKKNFNDLVIVYKEMDELVAYDRNPKLHPPEQIANLVTSLKRFGWRLPVLVDFRNNVLIAGHGRMLACAQLKNERPDLCRVPCIDGSDMSDEDIAAYRYLDNKLTESAWDMEILNMDLGDLNMDDFDLDWGIDTENESGDVVEDDYEAELPDEPVSKLGDIWQLGRHRLMVGDSTKAEDVQQLMGGQKADLLLTDPPYGVSYQGEGSATEARAKKGKGEVMSIQNDNLEGEEFVTFLQKAFEAADAVMKEGACFYIWHSDKKAWYFSEACKRVGFEVRQIVVWKKNSLVLGRSDYQSIHEPCLYGWKDGAGHLWASDRKQTTIVEFDKPKSNDIHPTMKPVGLFDYQMKNNTKGGDIVLDLFAGSGTTIIAAEQNGRDARCMEFDPKYADAIIKRWEEFTGQKAVKL